MKKKLLNMCLGLLFCGSAMAQMAITFDGLDVETLTQADGSQLIQLPDGTDLNNLGDKMTIKVDGVAVDPASITPNPTTTFITDSEIETFVYDGKAYSFRFTAGQYFTVVMFSDPHVAEGTGISVADMQDKANNMINYKYTFDELPGYEGSADLVFCLGDMDKDNEESGTNFKNAIAPFNNNNIPFITITGNHDLVPDIYWDDNEDYGYTYSGGANNNTALSLVKSQYATAATNGGFTVDRIYDTECDADFVIEHFAFKYKGVRFYCANNYWFQKSHDIGSIFSASKTTYAADGTINALKAYLNKQNTDGTLYKEDPAVWVSHFPFYSEANDYNDSKDRWWLDQNNAAADRDPVCLWPTDATSSEFYNNGVAVTYTSSEGKALAEKKRKALADIIVQTKNPRHFSGHSHKNDGQTVTANNGSTFRDHTIQPITNTGVSNSLEGNTFAVLCKSGVGIIAVKRVTF
ncbi:MAG: metallophosphoesterase [Paraprevotella sp.]|nr:metallophosphoesterase [Paraprevotella sp.]